MRGFICCGEVVWDLFSHFAGCRWIETADPHNFPHTRLQYTNTCVRVVKERVLKKQPAADQARANLWVSGFGYGTAPCTTPNERKQRRPGIGRARRPA